MKLFTFDDLADLTNLVPCWRSARFRRRLGELDYLCRAGRRRTVIDSLSRAFGGEMSPAEIRALARRIFERRAQGREPLQPRMAGLARQEMASIEGLDRLREALRKGKGAILWQSPFGSPTRATEALLREGFPITQVRGPEHGGAPSLVGQWIFRRIHRAAEAERLSDIVIIDESSSHYIEVLTSRLRDNGVVAMSGFGPLGRRFVELDFLGGREHFATGIVSLALVSGAALIPVFCFRDHDGSRRLVLEEAVPVPRSGNRQELYRQVLDAHRRLLESYIRQYPEQWSRWHAPLTSVSPAR